MQFAPLAIYKSIPKPTPLWDANLYANQVEKETNDDEEESYDDEEESYDDEEESYEEESYNDEQDVQLHRSHFVTSPQGVGRESRPVYAPEINPIDVTTRLPMPSLASPVEMAQFGGGGGGGDGGGDGGARCCGSDIPHFELRHTRETLGLNTAQRARGGMSAGEGESLSSTDERVSGTQQTQHGPVDVSDPLFTDDLYDQGFVSMSGVPSVYVGVYTDPLTGEEFDAYESAMPPPDADHEDTNVASGRNVKLAHLQGGWSDTTPRPTKVEVVEDDFHMVYDRSVNTYGTYDPSVMIDAIHHNNRFKRDDHHPDPEGPIRVGLPANTWGNQGDVKIRHVPYVTPTNRGKKWDETTFQSGIHGGREKGASRVDMEYTTVPHMRPESNRMDAGGGGVYTATMKHADAWDHHATQRSTTEHTSRPLGAIGGNASTNPSVWVHGTVPLPNGVNGTSELGEYGMGSGPTVGTQAFMLQKKVVSTPHATSGLETVEQLAFGAAGGTHENAKLMNGMVNVISKSGVDAVEQLAFGAAGGTHENAKLMNGMVDNVISKSGVDVNTHITRGAGNGGAHSVQHHGGIRTTLDKTKREALQKVQSTMDGFVGNYSAPASQAIRTRFSDKSGPLVDFLMPSGTLGGEDSLFTHGTYAHGHVTKLDTKRQAPRVDGSCGISATSTGGDNTLVWGNYRQGWNDHLSERTSGVVNPFAGAGNALEFRDVSEQVGK